MMNRGMVVVFLLCAALVSVSHATFNKENFKIEAGPGFSIPQDLKIKGSIGTIEVDLESAFAPVVAGVYRYSPWISGGVEIFATSGHDAEKAEFPDLDGDGIRDTLTRTSGNVGWTVTQVGPIIRIGKETRLGRVRVNPYGVAGVGAVIFKQNGGRVNVRGTTSNGTTGTATLNMPSDSSTYLGTSVGLGIGFPVGDHFEFGWDVQWHFVHTSGDDFQTYLPSFRLAYRFGA